MYFELTPHQVKRFEKQHGRSFYDLFQPTVANAISLFSLLHDLAEEHAVVEVGNIVITKDLTDWYFDVMSELTTLGYFEKKREVEVETEGVEEEGIPFFHVLWEESEADLIAIGVDRALYWHSTPKIVSKVVEKLVEKMVREQEQKEDYMIYAAQLQSLAFNDPRKLKIPDRRKEEEVERTDEEIAQMVARLRR